MKLIYIKGVTEYPEIKSDTHNISILLFDQKKYNGNMQDFVNTLADFEFDGIIIPASLDANSNYLGLELAVRIRLSKEKLNDKYLTSIFILDPEPPINIFKFQINNNTNPTASIFFTKGVFSFDDASLLSLLIDKKENYYILNRENYKAGFLDVIQVKQSPDFGNHSIANIWGAMQLANVTGNRRVIDSVVQNNQNIIKKKTDLYFMYITAQSNVIQGNNAKKEILSTGKNILFIDDEADKGWESVLKEIFVGANFESVKFSSNFLADAEKKALETNGDIPKWDLILLDLRLNETEDQGINAHKLASEYSGAKLLLKIKKENPGTQVIMFTATNKAWNIQKLRDLGSDGFYIKESPEYKFDESFSLNNYKNLESQIEVCFQKHFLRAIYAKALPIKHLCQVEMRKREQNRTMTISSPLIESSLEQFFIFSKMINDYPDELKWAYSPLILLTEEILNTYYYQDGTSQVVSKDSYNKEKCIYERTGDTYLAITPINGGQQYSSGEFKLTTQDDKNKYAKQLKFVPFNYRLTCLLHFKYGLPLNNSIFKYFDAYRKRSESVMHVGGSSISSQDILLLIELLTEIIK